MVRVTGSDMADFLLGATCNSCGGCLHPGFQTGAGFPNALWRGLRPGLLESETQPHPQSWPPLGSQHALVRLARKNSDLGSRATVHGVSTRSRRLVFPGDAGIPKTLAPTKYNNFGPRFGLAYSPGFSDGLLGKIFGGPGKTSIRASYGIYYTSVEDLTLFYEVADAPFGLYWQSPASVHV